MAPFDRSRRSSYSSSIVTVALSFIVSVINRYNIENRDFLYLLLHNNPHGKNDCDYFRAVYLLTNPDPGLPGAINRFGKSPLFTHSSRASQTDRQTEK